MEKILSPSDAHFKTVVSAPLAVAPALCLGMLLGMFLGMLLLAPAPAQAQLSVFDSVETKYNGLKPFPKWTGALERYFKEKQKNSGDCQKSRFNKCHYQVWNALIDRVRSNKPRYQLNKINTFFNRYRYIVDPINWGVKDYWESPGQFFSKYGDCEDYAIAKYLTLRILGWDPSKMRIVVLRDLNLKIAHAVLLVELKGKYLLLDNQISLVVDSARIRHYRAIYSVNEQSWWRHKSRRR